MAIVLDHPKNWIKNGVNFRYAIKMMIDFHVTIVQLDELKYIC